MAIWRIFGPEYGREVEIVGLKMWFLLEITERQWHKNIEWEMTKTPRQKAEKFIFW